MQPINQQRQSQPGSIFTPQSLNLNNHHQHLVQNILLLTIDLLYQKVISNLHKFQLQTIHPIFVYSINMHLKIKGPKILQKEHLIYIIKIRSVILTSFFCCLCQIYTWLDMKNKQGYRIRNTSIIWVLEIIQNVKYTKIRKIQYNILKSNIVLKINKACYQYELQYTQIEYRTQDKQSTLLIRATIYLN
eukprot:TRINITY_DN1873_c0_g1_i2.p2 TRINITY_DN1873_c0_g1~~TRINITY_DN1873_c0_g1_i2.p2  ORF type:complete len:189 (-),score=-34.97 TRINITY_DN1873_c0_g1_i2:97-663(-)